MLVKDIMLREVVTVSPFATIREAMRVMKQNKVKSLVVEKRDAHDAYGIITYTNIACGERPSPCTGVRSRSCSSSISSSAKSGAPGRCRVRRSAT